MTSRRFVIILLQSISNGPNMWRQHVGVIGIFQQWSLYEVDNSPYRFHKSCMG
jgi:hypothetical protein